MVINHLLTGMILQVGGCTLGRGLGYLVHGPWKQLMGETHPPRSLLLTLCNFLRGWISNGLSQQKKFQGNFIVYTSEFTNMTIAGKSQLFNRKYIDSFMVDFPASFRRV